MKTFLKAFSTKLTLVMLALASMATSAMAEVRLSFEDISLFLGTSAPVTVLMDNDEADVTNLQFDITLPENVTLDEATIQEKSSILSASQGFRWAKQNDGAYRFVITSSTRDGFTAAKGALLSFNVIAAEGVAQDAALTISQIVAEKDGVKLAVAAQPGVINVIQEGVSFDVDPAELTINGTAQVALSMTNSMELVGVQGTITLPEGLTLDPNEPFTASDRIPAGMTIDYRPATGKFVLSSTNNVRIIGNYGTLLTLNLVADATLAETSQITISALAASTPRAQSIRPDQTLTINVTNEVAPEIIYIETDLTAQFPLDYQGWEGASGFVGWAAPAVTTNDGRQTAACEKYEGTCANTGVVFSRTLTGLADGIYTIELYGAAAYTAGRGFESTLEEGDMTAVYLFAETEAGTIKQYIPAHVADNFNGTGIATAVLEGVEVVNGTVTIGMYKEKDLTNWHVVQIKGVTALVPADDALAAAVAFAENAQSDKLPAAVAQELASVINANKGTKYATAEEYIAAIEDLDEIAKKAQACTAAADKLAAMKQLIDATNVYTAEAYEEYYGKWAEAYERGTITFDEANALQNPFVRTEWHDATTVDNFLLSAWDTNPDFEDAPYYINTWSTEGETDGTNFKVPFFEYWTDDTNSLGEKTLTATMSGLTPGWYEVSAWVRVRAKNGTGAADATGITLVANDGEPVDVTEGETNGQFNLAEYKAVGEVAEDGVLKIQLVVAADNNISWLSFQNVMFVETEKPADPVVLNAPTWSVAEGTQAEPSVVPEGTTLKITYTADNLEDNHLTADDLKVKVTVTVYGDLPGAMMPSETAHLVSGETFEIPLGETDFPVELREGYVYQNIVIMSAQLVKGDEVIAEYAGAPIQLHWVEVPATTDPEEGYEAAMAAITDGGNYRIFTEVEGQKYYVTEAGLLTDAVEDGGIFTFNKVTGGALYDTGIQISSGSKRFTNPPLANNVADLTSGVFATSTNNRVDWETQVLFKNAYDQYAIRSCNTQPATSSWGDAGRTFWTFAAEEAVIPQYTYDQVYVWQIEGPITTINVTYQLYESDGTTKVSAVTKKQEANSAVNVPADLTFNKLLYSYEVTGTIADEDCEIAIVRTMKNGVVHDLADLSNEKAYQIGCDRGAFLTNDGYMVSTGLSSLAAADPADFAIITYEDNIYVYSIADQKFVTNTGALAEWPTHGTDDAFIMEPKTDPYFFTYFSINGTNNGLNTNGNAPYGYVINNWMTADAGNQYFMLEAGDFDPTDALAALEAYFHPSYTVTYVIKDVNGDEIFISDPQPAREGEHITSVPADLQRPFTSFSTIDVTVVDQETTVEVTATWNGPFELSTTFAGAKWYNMTIRGDYYVAMDESEPYYPKADKDLDAPESQWAFAGDAFNGIFVYNKAAGDGWTLTKDGNNAVMREGEYAWTIGANADGFTLKEPGTDYNCINQNGGTSGPLQFWNSGNAPTDNGSTFRVTAVEVVSPVKVFTINVDRYVGMGYTPTVATVAAEVFEEAKQHLGVEELTTSMLDIVKPNGVVEFEYSDYDGWFNTQGYPETWNALNAEAEPADKAGICVKFFQALPDGQFEICDMNGADVVGTTYTVKWEFQANGKAAWFEINVTFVEAPDAELDIVKTIEGGSVEYASADGSYIEKTVSLSDDQVTEILTALGLASLDDATVYGWNPSTETAVTNYEGYDGWRDVNGDFHTWTGNEEVPACVKYTNGKDYYTYNIQGSFSGSIDTYWAIANDNNQAVLVKITFVITATDVQKALEDEIANAEALIVSSEDTELYNQDDQRLIDAVAALNTAIQAAKDKLGTSDDAMTAAIEDLQAAEEVFRGALTGINGVNADMQNTIYDLSGRKIQKIQRGGIYIINGQKVAVK